jgi:hypothetical protein
MRKATYVSGSALALLCGALVAYGAACSGSNSPTPGNGSPSPGNGSPGFGGSGGGSGGSGGGNGSGGGTGGGSGGMDAGSPGNTRDSATPLVDAGGSVDPDMACYGMDAGACANCCYTNHTAGGTVADNAFYGCICAAMTCQTQCAQSDCSDEGGAPTPGDPCDLCEQQNAPLDGGGSCGPQITAACNASPDCVAFINCESNCP